MKNGFIYPFIKSLINCLYTLNIVEWWKKIYFKMRVKKDSDKIEIYNEAIDLFIFFKYLFLIYLYLSNKTSNFYFYLILYLIISNFFTYFYYHVWESKESKNIKKNKESEEKMGREREQRRFVSLILAICYSNIAFGYLYKVSIANFKPFLKNISLNLEVIYSSFMTSFGSTLTPENVNGLLLIFLNVIINLLFIVIILSNTDIKKIKNN